MKRGFIESSDSEEEESRADWKRRAAAMIKKTGFPAPTPEGTPADRILEGPLRLKVLTDYLANRANDKLVEEEHEDIHVEFYGIDDEIAWIKHATGVVVLPSELRELKEGK